MLLFLMSWEWSQFAFHTTEGEGEMGLSLGEGGRESKLLEDIPYERGTYVK